MTIAKGHLYGMECLTFSQKLLGLATMLTMNLVLFFGTLFFFSELALRSLNFCHLLFQRNSPTTKPVSVSVHMLLSGNLGEKIYPFGFGHITKMADIPIYDTKLKQPFCQNR